MTTLVVKLLVFYKEQDKLLLLLLRRAAHLAWCPDIEDLPGGKMEIGETITEAAKRELKEETGLDLTWANLLISHEYEAQLGNYCKEFLLYTIVDTKEVTINPREHSSFRWINFEMIEHSELHPKVKEIILSQQAMIKQALIKWKN